MKKHKIVLDNQRMTNNGMFASVKGAVFEIEPILAEMAKSIDEDVSVSVEIKLIGKSSKTQEEVEEATDEEGDVLPEVDLKLQDDLDDPLAGVAHG